MANKQVSDSTAFRAALRRERLIARESLDAIEHARLSALLEARLAALLATRPRGTLAFCWPLKGEFDARPIVSTLIAEGWLAALPVTLTGASPLVFRAWTPGAALQPDIYGIPAPADGAPLLPDVVLVPLVAFDDAGFRIGFGGGYFDRTLAAMVPRPFAVGLGFELGRVASIHPQPHDIPMDAVVTELRTDHHPRRGGADISVFSKSVT